MKEIKLHGVSLSAQSTERPSVFTIHSLSCASFSLSLKNFGLIIVEVAFQLKQFTLKV